MRTSISTSRWNTSRGSRGKEGEQTQRQPNSVAPPTRPTCPTRPTRPRLWPLPLGWWRACASTCVPQAPAVARPARPLALTPVDLRESCRRPWSRQTVSVVDCNAQVFGNRALQRRYAREGPPPKHARDVEEPTFGFSHAAGGDKMKVHPGAPASGAPSDSCARQIVKMRCNDKRGGVARSTNSWLRWRRRSARRARAGRRTSRGPVTNVSCGARRRAVETAAQRRSRTVWRRATDALAATCRRSARLALANVAFQCVLAVGRVVRVACLWAWWRAGARLCVPRRRPVFPCRARLGLHAWIQNV